MLWAVALFPSLIRKSCSVTLCWMGWTLKFSAVKPPRSPWLWDTLENGEASKTFHRQSAANFQDWPSQHFKSIAQERAGAAVPQPGWEGRVR